MVQTISLGRLKAVDPRDYWKDEARDFTPWLAQQENIALLGEVLGLELEVQATEQSVGPFRADILCKEMASDHIVLIENQLEKTDHNHLGQILTYAAGLQAVTIVWIARTFTDEHRAALDWLNQVTDETINFFGLEVELWRIGDSTPAPKFNVVSKPNLWSKSVIDPKDHTPTQALQLEYWTAFGDYLRQKKYPNIPKPRPDNYLDYPIGRSGFWLTTQCSRAASSQPVISVTLCMRVERTKESFDVLDGMREAIEAQFGETLTWDRYDNGKASYVTILHPGDYTQRKDWNCQFDWFHKHLLRYREVFGPRIKTLTLSSEE